VVSDPSSALIAADSDALHAQNAVTVAHAWLPRHLHGIHATGDAALRQQEAAGHHGVILQGML
jgi:hypothetical protein